VPYHEGDLEPGNPNALHDRRSARITGSPACQGTLLLPSMTSQLQADRQPYASQGEVSGCAERSAAANERAEYRVAKGNSDAPPCLQGYRAGLPAFLEAITDPAALARADGQIVYVNGALSTVLEVPAMRQALPGIIVELARRAASDERAATASRRTSAWMLRAQRIGPPAVGECGTLVAIVLNPKQPASADEVRFALQRRFKLTARELEVAQLLADGLSTKAMARELDVSWHTARGHIERTMRKLAVRSRSQAAALVLGIAGSPRSCGCRE
jgi:DNA-binding CsgD family transcriptional regulator